MSYRLCSQGPLPSLVASIATHSVCNWVRSCPFCLRVHSALFVFSSWQLLSWLDRHGHCESGSKTARKDWEVDHMCSQGRRNWGRLAAPPWKRGPGPSWKTTGLSKAPCNHVYIRLYCCGNNNTSQEAFDSMPLSSKLFRALSVSRSDYLATQYPQQQS